MRLIGFGFDQLNRTKKVLHVHVIFIANDIVGVESHFFLVQPTANLRGVFDNSSLLVRTVQHCSFNRRRFSREGKRVGERGDDLFGFPGNSNEFPEIEKNVILGKGIYVQHRTSHESHCSHSGATPMSYIINTDITSSYDNHSLQHPL